MLDTGFCDVTLRMGPISAPYALTDRQRFGDRAAAPIREIASFLHGWAAVKRWGASRFGYSAGAFRVLCHAFRCCDSIAVPIFPLFSPPGCSINPSKSRGGTPDPCGAFSKGLPTSNVRAIPFRGNPG